MAKLDAKLNCKTFEKDEIGIILTAFLYDNVESFKSLYQKNQ